MSRDLCLSRRASLKSLGTMGAAVLLGAPAAAQRPADPKPAAADKDKQPVNVVEVAAGRMAKGHS